MYFNSKKIVTACWGMHVSPAKHSYESVTDRRTDGQTDRRTDGQTDRQTTDKVIPMCRYASQATQKWIYAYLSANRDITNIFQFLAVFAQKFTISPKMNNVWLTSTLHYSLTICHTVSYHCARFYTSKPTNIETTYIFWFLTIFFI